MKLLALLMTMLAVDHVSGVKATVSGVLKCKQPFYAKIQLKEIDDWFYFRDDDFAEPLEFEQKNGQTEVHFQFTGEASDPFWFDGVEPKLVIKYSFYGSPVWICKKFGTIREDFRLNEIVQLDDPTDLKNKGYYLCTDEGKGKMA